MASTSTVLRTCGLTFYLILQVHATVNNSSQLFISSLKVGSLSCDENRCKYLLNVKGSEFLGQYPLRLTSEVGSKGGNCDVIYPNYELKEIETTQWFSKVEVVVPKNDGKIYFCLHNAGGNSPFGGKWVHHGTEHYLEPNKDAASQKSEEFLESTEKSTQEGSNGHNEQQTQETKNDWIDLTHDIDVNYLPSIVRPTREDRNVEVIVDGRFVPIDKIDNTVFNDDSASETIQENIDKSMIKENNYVNNVVDVDDDAFGNDPISNNKVYIPNNFAQNLLNDIVKKSDINNNIDDLINEVLNVNENEINIKSENKVSSIAYLKNNGSELVNAIASEDIANNNTVKDMPNENTITNIVENYISDEDKVDISNEDKIRKRRQLPITEVDFHSVRSADPRPNPLIIEGIRVEDSSKEPKIIDESIPSVLADSSVTLRVYGEGLTPGTVIAFTHDAQTFGQPCKFLLKGEYVVKEGSLTRKTALFDITVPSPITGDKLYICAKNLKPGNLDPSVDEEKYLHQGTETWKMLASHNNLLPLWVSFTLILTCLMFSALFSGLNLGLMSLDKTELKIISNTGTEQERKYARAIMPVRDHGNYLLCSILLGNVAVNSTFTILLDELTSGLFAVIFSTLSIVLLGEITPQAICSRHGLMVGAKTIVVTKAVMAVTAPLSFPVSKLLDYFLGEEIGSVYNRERLKELVKVTTDVNDLDKDEVNIISGALELRKKTVSDVMTKLEDAFMLPITSILDFETMSELVKSGFSRIPVYEGERGNIVTVLFIKDLAFVDPDDNTPLRTLCQYYQNTCNFVFEDVTLDIMFKQFKDGHKGHMAFVHRINNEGEGDPFYETIGLVTLEDVIEEMIQAEIVDETDVFTDNRSKRRRNRPQNKLQDFAAFAERHENQRIHISPQLTLATFQFLSTSVDAFRPDTVSETVLRRLLRQDVIHYIKVKEKSKKDATTYVFQQGKPVDYFILILEGRVEVTVGRENLVFEAGPFTYFGVQALTQNVGVAESPTPSAMGSLQNINMDAMLRHTFVPDYSVRAITSVHYLTVKRSLYLAAKRATLMEKGNISKGGTNEQFDTEVDKLLQSVDEDLSITGEHKTPSRQVSPNPMPVSPAPRLSTTLEPRNGHAYAPPDEQERLLK